MTVTTHGYTHTVLDARDVSDLYLLALIKGWAVNRGDAVVKDRPDLTTSWAGFRPSQNILAIGTTGV